MKVYRDKQVKSLGNPILNNIRIQRFTEFSKISRRKDLTCIQRNIARKGSISLRKIQEEMVPRISNILGDSSHSEVKANA